MILLTDILHSKFSSSQPHFPFCPFPFFHSPTPGEGEGQLSPSLSFSLTRCMHAPAERVQPPQSRTAPFASAGGKGGGETALTPFFFVFGQYFSSSKYFLVYPKGKRNTQRNVNRREGKCISTRYILVSHIISLHGSSIVDESGLLNSARRAELREDDEYDEQGSP